MNIDDSQKKPFIVLCCLIALVIGFGVYRVVGVNTNAATCQSPLSQGTSSKPVTKETAKQNVSAEVVETGSGTNAVTEVEGRDPFAPQPLTKIVSKSTERNAVRQPRPEALAPMFPRMPLPNMITRPVPGASSVSSMDADMARVRELQVTGIINGSIKLAIIRAGDARYIVREGQLICSRYTVEHITADSVWIKVEDRNFVLHLGGSGSGEKRTRA